MKKGFTFSRFMSMIIGAGSGWLLGYWIYHFLLNKMIITSNIEIIFYILTLSSLLIGLIFGYFLPILTESLALALSIYIFFQYLWDTPAGDLNKFRDIMGITALVLFLINIFTGNLRIGTAKKTIRNALGIGR